MTIYSQINIMSKIVAALALFLLMGWSLTANAEDFMPETDPAAPCGELHLIGNLSYIFNPSDFRFNVKFTTKASRHSGYSINAGAVKYLERDTNGLGVWRDTSVGDYRSSKIYTVPVKSKEVVTIAYCASNASEFSLIKGEVSFDADPREALHRSPASKMTFSGWDGYSDDIRWHGHTARDVMFDESGTEPDVHYNVNPSGAAFNGSIIICPHDTLCSIQ